MPAGWAEGEGHMKINDYLSREELARFTAKSDLHAWRLVLGNWCLIAVIFAAVGTWTNPLTILLAIILLGGDRRFAPGQLRSTGIGWVYLVWPRCSLT